MIEGRPCVRSFSRENERQKFQKEVGESYISEERREFREQKNSRGEGGNNVS